MSSARAASWARLSTAQLRQAGADVRAMTAPRLTTNASTSDAMVADASARIDLVAGLSRALEGARCVVNAAGLADAASHDRAALFGANALLPLVVQRACWRAGVERFVHVSSAAVQGRILVLDESPTWHPFSAYSRSKVLAEQGLRQEVGSSRTVVFRPTSVHGPARNVTRSLTRLAASRAASVAGTGDRPTPQVLVDNVGAAVAHVVESAETPPDIVLQPWEGLTTADLLRILGSREPRRIPESVATALVSVASWAGRRHVTVAAHARRLEMVWLGQDQAVGWLTKTGWRPPTGLDGWHRLASSVRHIADQKEAARDRVA